MLQAVQMQSQRVREPTATRFAGPGIRTTRILDREDVYSLLDDVEASAAAHVIVDCESTELLELLISNGFVLGPVLQAGSSSSEISLLRWKKAGAVDEFLPPIPKRGIYCGKYTLTYPRLDDRSVLVNAEIDQTARSNALFPPMSDSDAHEVIASAYLGWRRGPASTLIVRATKTGEPVGKLMVRKLVPPGVIDAGYMTFPTSRGLGVAATSLRALTDWLFRWSTVRRIELGIKPDNSASIRTAECAGYTFESRRARRLRNVDGSYDDEISYVSVKGIQEVAR